MENYTFIPCQTLELMLANPDGFLAGMLRSALGGLTWIMSRRRPIESKSRGYIWKAKQNVNPCDLVGFCTAGHFIAGQVYHSAFCPAGWLTPTLLVWFVMLGVGQWLAHGAWVLYHWAMSISSAFSSMENVPLSLKQVELVFESITSFSRLHTRPIKSGVTVTSHVWPLSP